MRQLDPRIGELTGTHFDEVDASLRAFIVSIKNPTATEDVAVGNQKCDGNRFAATVLSAMSKARVQ